MHSAAQRSAVRAISVGTHQDQRGSGELSRLRGFSLSDTERLSGLRWCCWWGGLLLPLHPPHHQHRRPKLTLTTRCSAESCWHTSGSVPINYVQVSHLYVLIFAVLHIYFNTGKYDITLWSWLFIYVVAQPIVTFCYVCLLYWFSLVDTLGKPHLKCRWEHRAKHKFKYRSAQRNTVKIQQQRWVEKHIQLKERKVAANDLKWADELSALKLSLANLY